jgi:hypothetical protein
MIKGEMKMLEQLMYLHLFEDEGVDDEKLDELEDRYQNLYTSRGYFVVGTDKVTPPRIKNAKYITSTSTWDLDDIERDAGRMLSNYTNDKHLSDMF